MAVYEQSYERYTGPLTPPAPRFLVIPRYAYLRLAGSKLAWALLVASTLIALATTGLIYLKYNTRALAALSIQGSDLLSINAVFFDAYLAVQLVIGFFLVLLVGPTLISMDLSNGALPLYFSRPIRRSHYVLGKLLVLAAGLSVISWGYGLALFGLQTSLAGAGWAVENARIALALFLGSSIWILTMSFLTLALSALIRWPLAVRGVLLALFLVAPGFGQALAVAGRSDWGHVINLGADFEVVLAALFGIAPSYGPPLAVAWGAIILTIAVSFLLLWRKLRAFEVVA